MNFIEKNPIEPPSSPILSVDDDATDTEEDSGIAEEPDLNSFKEFPDLCITDSIGLQGNALNNFFNYWLVFKKKDVFYFLK